LIFVITSVGTATELQAENEPKLLVIQAILVDKNDFSLAISRENSDNVFHF